MAPGMRGVPTTKRSRVGFGPSTDRGSTCSAADCGNKQHGCTVSLSMTTSDPPLIVVTTNLTLKVFPTVRGGGVHENVRVVESKLIPSRRKYAAYFSVSPSGSVAI